MRPCFVILLLSLPFFAISQQNQIYRIEFGLDLTSMIAVASGHFAQTYDLEMIYKENLEKHDLRFKVIIQSPVGDYEFVNRVTMDSARFYNYFQPSLNYGINAGFARRKSINGLPIYYGIDGNAFLNTGRTVVTEEPLNEIPLDEDFFRVIDNHFFTIGVIPFIGTKLNLTDRMFFTLEFGTGINYNFGERSYMNASQRNATFPIRDFAFSLNRLINDIAISYRF